MTTQYRCQLLLSFCFYLCCCIYPATSFFPPECHPRSCVPTRSERRNACNYKSSSSALLVGKENNDGFPPNTHHRHRQRIPQTRQQPRNRRPKNYWLNVTNVEQELRDLWATVVITNQEENDSSNRPPPIVIPNEALLNYWKRHDLRAAITSHGGRQQLAELFGEGCIIIHGKWSDAVQMPIVQELLEQDSNLSRDLPPLSPQQLRLVEGKSVKQSEESSVRREKKAPRKRKEKGYWSDRVVVQEL
jgi:hypothetical protein